MTNGSEKFKKFLTTPFTIDMLFPIFNEKSCETLFIGWKGENMLGWYKFTYNNKIILEFYSTYYIIKKDIENSMNYKLSLPITIDNFINDMNRFGIQLNWSDWIDNNFEPKEYLSVTEIKSYFNDLLSKIGKSHELL